jgi:DNA-directed RNA polymerase subunit RPC12/RpoP
MTGFWGAPRGRQKASTKEKAMAAISGYCLKCKKKVDIKDPQHITMKNGKPATTGTCPTCGTKIYKIGKA